MSKLDLCIKFRFRNYLFDFNNNNGIFQIYSYFIFAIHKFKYYINRSLINMQLK